MSVSGLEKLDVWCKARDFAVRVRKELIPLLPAEEKWALNQQIRRSSQSVPANIAEGHGRFFVREESADYIIEDNSTSPNSNNEYRISNIE